MRSSSASVVPLRPGTTRNRAACSAGKAGGDLANASDRLLPSLVARMADRDQSALSEFYDITVTRLHVFALRIVRDPGLAQEVIEDVLFQAWREASRYDQHRGKVLAWMMTICRSRALDALRRVDAAICVEDPDVFRSYEASLALAPEHLLRQCQAGNAVHAALLRLPANERQVVSLAFFRGFTHQEIADHWQMPVGSVKTLMHRAFVQLRSDLQEERST